jgi:hypothetical protein
VRARLLDAHGTERGTAEGAEATIAVPSAHLWRPGEGYQYALVVELSDAEGLVDSYRQLFGIRTVEVRGTDFLVNGTPFYFRGFGMHEDHAVLGKGQENAAMVHDFALLERYANPRIRHLLRQIAADGSQKVPIRILPTVRAELARGAVPTGAARVLAAWVCHLRGLGAPVADVAADEFVALAAGDLDDAVARVLERLGVDDSRVRASASALAHELER